MPDFRFTDVDSEYINSAVAKIDGYISDLQSMQKIFGSDIISSLEPYWQGMAKIAFDQKFIRFTLDYTEIIKGYNELNMQLKEAAKKYEGADSQVKQIIARLPR